MNNKQYYILIVVLLIIVVVALYHTNARLDRIELATSGQGKVVQMHATTFQTSINIDKVEGNGHAFGDNNKVENKIA